MVVLSLGSLIAARVELTREFAWTGRTCVSDDRASSPVLIFRAATGEFRFLRRIW